MMLGLICLLTGMLETTIRYCLEFGQSRSNIPDTCLPEPQDIEWKTAFLCLK